MPYSVSSEHRLTELARRACARLSIPSANAGLLFKLAIASDFAIDTLTRQPELLANLQDTATAPMPAPCLTLDNRGEWQRLLRRYRHAESTRLIWRDVIEGGPVEEILAGSTALAEKCLSLALEAAQADFAQRHGVVRNAQGEPQRLIVFALGKLGGGELNFSSDIDLVYAFTGSGQSDGARALHAEDYFAKLGQQLLKLLDEITADGFCHRVDLRLRPFGTAGRTALSLAAMEHYFQREGRDWERYAWQKARAVAGDVEAGETFLHTLRPFVYRRYLDFGALEGLRSMKASIAAEVARKELADDIKRGPGGIREVEFLVQALQLIRGGRDAGLRQRSFSSGLRALVDAGCIARETGEALALAYGFLRRLENRLQMLGDAQTQALPSDTFVRERIAHGMQYPDWDALRAELDARRLRIAEEFAALLAPRTPASGGNADDSLRVYWRALPDAQDGAALMEAGFADAPMLHALLRDFSRAPGVRELSDATRARLDRVMPALLGAAAGSSQPDVALRRLLALLHNILRRSSYLALLDEQPGALARLVDAVARSGFLAERIATHPMLLDELLEMRVSGALPGGEALRALCEAAAAAAGDDTEAVLQALNETRQALSFRIALATLDGRQQAQDSARQLAWLADAVVRIVVCAAQRDIARMHGTVSGAQFAVIGYGSLGGEELGFGSDLDLVFLYRLPDSSDGLSDGARPLEAVRWYARLTQKIVALLQAPTASGKLYEVDVRLRPDGAKGLLVSTLQSYADYQRERAWTWEHQALVRARSIAGDAALCERSEQVRGEVLARPRNEQQLRHDVMRMRAKMRAELDRTDATRFDLKQGQGGLVDLEFLLQFLVLRNAHAYPQLLVPHATPALIAALRDARCIDAATAEGVLQAHAVLLEAGLRCTLDRRGRLVPRNTALAGARAAINHAVQTHGLQFG